MKLKRLNMADGSLYAWSHCCPGCKSRHVIPMIGPNPWAFNGDMERPTFSPSVLHRWNEGEEQTERVCHYFITDGVIQFCSDSKHELAGQSVPLPEIHQ